MSFPQAFKPDVLRSIDSSTFSGSYQAVGSALTVNPVVVKFYNDSSVAVTVSWDGSTNNDYFATKSGFVIDIAANKQIEQVVAIRKGTQFYAKGTAGTGSFYITVFYLSS